MRDLLAPAGVIAVAVVCCSLLPLLVAAGGGLSLGAAFGWGAALLALAIGCGVAVWRQARRNEEEER